MGEDVLNLLSNAFKFAFEGEIAVSLRESASNLELIVSDTGTGVPPEELPRLFDRFHRVKGAMGRSYEGSAVGLALVQELAQLHGGSVRSKAKLIEAADSPCRFRVAGCTFGRTGPNSNTCPNRMARRPARTWRNFCAGFPERTEMEHGSPALCVKLFRTRLPAAGNALCSRTMIRSAIKYRRAHVTPVIHIDAKRQSAQWIFAVTDNGIGIDPVCKERIFGLFKRLHDNDTYWGTGIGLALSQRIVEHYHGRIRVESEPGIGWKFHFTLPV